MSDTNLNDASFIPDINDSEESTNKQAYSATGSFRFWCQKVLPLVYDDSLSYYELLCKVVNYLNNVIQNVDNLNTSVDNTNTAFNNLQNYVNATKDTLVEVYGELEQYVNDYFNNLDVQEEINSKLDSMAEDGSLSTIISPFIPSIVANWLSENITPTSPAVDASLSVSGAAADAKVTGDFLRTNAEDLKNSINDIALNNAFDVLAPLSRSSIERNGLTFTPNDDGSYTVTGTASGTAYLDYFTSATSLPLGLIKGHTYYIDYHGDNLTFRIFTYVNGTIKDLYNSFEGGSVTIPDNIDGIIIRVSASNGLVVNETVNPKMLSGTKNEEITDFLRTNAEDLKNYINDIALNNAFDVLAPLTRSSIEHNGLTFTPNEDGSYTVTGTASGTAYLDYFTSATSLPLGLIKGHTYYIDYHGDNLTFRIFTYVNGTIKDLYNSFEGGSVTIPDNIDGIIIRVSASNGLVVNETVNPKMLSGTKNEEITDKINRSVKVVEGVYSRTSIDDAERNTIVIADGTTVSNLPDTSHTFIVQTIYTTSSNVAGQQTAYNFSTGDMYWRRKVAGTWESAWKDYRVDLSLYRAYRGVLPNNSDFDNITGICTYLVAQDYTYYHAPFEGFIGTVDSAILSPWIAIQTATELDTGVQYYRIRSGSEPIWKDWIKLSNKYNVSGKYVAFGDSVTLGAIWDRNQTTPYYQADIAYQLPTRIAIATGMDNNFINEADSGVGYYNQGVGQSITEKIMSYNFTGVDLVTIMAGVNDKTLADHPLGTAENPVTGTICAAIKSILDWFSANYPAVQIVIIQPTPSGHLADPWNGTLEAGWSLNTFDTEVSKLCAAEHVGYVNWNDCTMCKNWDSFSGGYHKTESGTVIGPNYSHMANETDYMRIGDYIAAKVAMFYHGRN